MDKVISIDAETDGLWGKPFAIGAKVYSVVDDEHKEIDSILVRLDDSVVTNRWVIDNVLPSIKDVDVTHAVYIDMLKTFADFYMKHKGATTLWHMGHVVEAYLFRELVSYNLIGEFDAPYTPIEVSELLRIECQDPASVDNYLSERGIKIAGEPHNPLYDCEAAFKAYSML